MALAALFIGLSLTVQGAGQAGATAIGPLDTLHVRGTGEILEPSGSKPTASNLPNAQDSEEPAALQSIPKPSFDIYEGLDRDISQSKNGRRDRTDNFFGVEGLSELPFSLSAYEWTQQMSENGYWLENDQWADFRAIALAGYLPEIRYWLGRDRWASFDFMEFGSELGGGFTNGTLETPDGLGYVTSPEGGSYYRSFTGLGGKPKAGEQAAKKQSASEVFLSMLKKLAKQPLLYLALLGGAVLLYFALKRQSLASTS